MIEGVCLRIKGRKTVYKDDQARWYQAPPVDAPGIDRAERKAKLFELAKLWTPLAGPPG
jgi:hypothetical protein